MKMFQELINMYKIFQLFRGHIRTHYLVYTAKDTRSDVSHTTSARALTDRIIKHLGGRLHLYLELSTCDYITREACSCQLLLDLYDGISLIVSGLYYQKSWIKYGASSCLVGLYSCRFSFIFKSSLINVLDVVSSLPAFTEHPHPPNNNTVCGK